MDVSPGINIRTKSSKDVSNSLNIATVKEYIYRLITRHRNKCMVGF